MSNSQAAALLSEALQKLRYTLEEARENGVPEPYTMSLATVDKAGKPSVRSILLANVNDVGLLFFVNKQSGKGVHLAQNPNVACCFFWPSMQLQVVIDGVAEQESDAEANKIWSKRGRANQLAAWASRQSQQSAGKKALASRMEKMQDTFTDERVPMPEHWAGYRVLPKRIEFWHTGWRHMKDRVRYSKDGEVWTKTMLDP